MADEAHAWTDEQLELLEARMRSEYSQALKEVQEKAEQYFKAFEKADAEKKALVDSGEMVEADYRKWRAAKVATGKRYRQMVADLSKTLTNSTQVCIDMLNGELPGIYAFNHDFGTWEIESGTTIDTSYTLYSHDAVLEAMQDRQLYPEAALDEAKDMRWNRQHFNSSITQGLLQGEPMGDIAKRLSTVVGMSASTAMRAARTSVTSAENFGRLDSFNRAKRMGIDVKKRWLATLDRRTRHSHRQVDGEVVGLEEKFSNGLDCPGDPDGPGGEVYNCRCAMVADLSDFPDENVQRWSRLDGMTYDEWREEHAER